MDIDDSAERGRVIGIGGIFFKSSDREKLRAWYKDNLGIVSETHGTEFKWRRHERPEEESFTVWSVFPAETKYFEPSPAPYMINYIVDDLDALLAKIDRGGPNADVQKQDSEFGRFAWVIDPDGNKIELWEPPKPKAE